MSSSHPLRPRPNSSEPDLPRPTTPLRINKHPSSPQHRQGLSPRQSSSSQTHVQVQVARRSSNSFKHVRENNLVTKSPFRALMPSALGFSPSSRKVSGEKRPRPDSMHAQAENEKPLGFKRRQSKGFQGLLQKEPVTKSPFRRSSDSASSDPPPPPLPPKARLRPTTPSAIPAPSPVRSVLSNPRKMHGPRIFGDRQRGKHQKTVTFDEKCDVLEFSAGEEDLEDPYYDEDGYGYGYSYDAHDQDQPMEDSFDSSSHVGDDSITGMVDSMLQAALPHTPPRPEDEEDVGLLPPSPSPAKPRHHSPAAPVNEGSSSHSLQPQPDQYSQPQIKDEDPPFEDSFRSVGSIGSNDSLDPANLSIGHSEVSITNLDSHSLLADTDFEGDLLSDAQFAPVAGSSPAARSRSRSRSATPLDRSFERTVHDRSFEARSTPSITPNRFNSPHSASGSPFQRQLFKPSSTSSLGNGSAANVNVNGIRRASPLITREAVQERLLRRKSEEALAASRSASASPAPVPPTETEEGRDGGSAHVDADVDVSRTTEHHDDDDDDKPSLAQVIPLMMARSQNPTHDGVMSIDPEPQPIDPPRPSMPERAHSIDVTASEMDAKRAFAGLELDFEHGFGLGEEGMSVSAGLGIGMGARARHSGVHLGDVSALDKLMEDMAQGVGMGGAVSGNTSMVSEGRSLGSLRVEAVTGGVKAQTFALPDIVQDDEGIRLDLVGLRTSPHSAAPVAMQALGPTFSASPSPPPPPPPAKDAIRARDELIKAKKREARQRDEDMFDSDAESPAMLSSRAAVIALGNGRPTRRRSMSTGDAEQILANRPSAAQRRATRSKDDDLLDITALRGEDAPLADTINRELQKREGQKRIQKYHVRERTETIYASADTGGEPIVHGLEDENHVNRAWRTIRRASDMNEHAERMRELKAQQQPSKGHGKIFVKVVGLKDLNVPIPAEPTHVNCTLNNGIHFVTTPDTRLARDCTIDQEFELIEHSKLEFTLTIKVRNDPHIRAQIKASQAPPVRRPPPQPVPVPASKGGGNSKSGGMRSFLGLGSPKKPKTAQRAASPVPPPPPPPEPISSFEPPENLVRYMKRDGSLGRAFISFKEIRNLCDTRLMETTFPLIGQRTEVGTTTKSMPVGEIVLQMFWLPALPGISQDQLPQSLEECHRGLTHTRWHKSCYMQGTLTQIGGDCTTWRRRHLRIIGCGLVAYNDVTRKAIASIDLRKATGVEDVSSPVLSPASGATSRSGYDDNDPYGVGGVERSFRLEFGTEHILFYADTDQEKENWLKILKALIGRIPPNPLWAEVLWAKQAEASATTQQAQQTTTPAPTPPPR